MMTHCPAEIDINGEMTDFNFFPKYTASAVGDPANIT